MAKKNKPKRYNRHRSPMVARRKKRKEILIYGKKRTRAKRPKHKNSQIESV